MDSCANILLRELNVGLTLALTLGALLLLRPLMERVFSPQQRAAVWMAGWIMAYLFPGGLNAVLPISFQSLIVPRTGRLFNSAPAFLPDEYSGPGLYNLALPGSETVRITLSDGPLLALFLLWLAGMLTMILIFWFRSRRLLAAGRRGRKLEKDDPLLQLAPPETRENLSLWITPGLPTSFVFHFFELSHIFLQEELPPERMELVFRHELKHIRLGHTGWKLLASICLIRFWWNPLVWLAFRLFCRDLELACDAAVLKELESTQRREYAQTLVELGTGRQLWEAPLSFGECDAALRVKRAVAWRPRKLWLTVLTWALAILVYLFFCGCHRVPFPNQDLMLVWEKETGSTASFVSTLNHEMACKLGLATHGQTENIPDVGILEVWDAPDKLTYPGPHDALWLDHLIPSRPDWLRKLSPIPLAALWVRTEDSWYHVWYGWYGSGINTFFVIGMDEIAPPRLAGWERLI